ncbi:MAG: hypothetical protein Q4D90_10730 [bacterium]|nr:hypothetical protein [bacterium]
MKRQKLVSVFCATALFALLQTATVFAAGWTTNSQGQWIYLDNNGEKVYDEWRKDASGQNYYYLNHNGVMATNTLVDGIYYVDSNGVMVRNSWQRIQDDDWDGELSWYYFADSGKAVESGWKTINGQRYFFDDYKMKTGWMEYNDATYYFDDSGSMAEGWRYLYPSDEDSWNEEYWYYFANNGKMSASKEQKINGSYYLFDGQGRMLSGWANPSNFTCSYFDNLRDAQNIDSLRYYKESGAQASGWVYTMTPDGFDEGWYYLRDGRAYSPNYRTTKLDNTYCVAKIDGKVYCFDNTGLMMTDLVETSDGRIFYFEEDGRMATGDVTIDGEKFYMDTSGKLGSLGSAYTGVKNGYLYENGVRVTADDGSKYEIKTVEGKQYLVNENGKIKTSGTAKDSYGTKYTVKKNGSNGYIITTE